MGLKSKLRLFWTAGRGVTKGLSQFPEGVDPIELFSSWYSEAERSGILLPESMTLATASLDARPSARMVLLKQFDKKGFVFFTNYGSRKAHELDNNDQVALLFHWGVLQRQVRIEGRSSRVSKEESAAYFASRPRKSQLGALASKQSRELESREKLEARFRQAEEKHSGRDIPPPDFWGGYRVVPDSIEFWQGRANRLHDRILFVRDGASWMATRLYP